MLLNMSLVPEEFRLSILQAQIAAIGRFKEVSDAISRSKDRPMAAKRVSRILEVDNFQSQTILDLSWVQLTVENRRLLSQECSRLYRLVEDRQ